MSRLFRDVPPGRRPAPADGQARARRRDETGSATAFVLGMAVTLLACAGLVLDGGNALNARMALADQVEQAARAGAQEIDVEHLRSAGEIELVDSAAASRAREYLEGYDDVRVEAADGQVRVTASDTVTTILLGLVGVHSFDIEATATAEAVTQ